MDELLSAHHSRAQSNLVKNHSGRFMRRWRCIICLMEGSSIYGPVASVILQQKRLFIPPKERDNFFWRGVKAATPAIFPFLPWLTCTEMQCVGTRDSCVKSVMTWTWSFRFTIQLYNAGLPLGFFKDGWTIQNCNPILKISVIRYI